MKQELFIRHVKCIVYDMLDKMNFFVNEWHSGKVKSINEDKTLNISLDGSTHITPSVPANPDVVFAVDDYIWVHFVNKNPNNLFVPYKKHIVGA